MKTKQNKVARRAAFFAARTGIEVRFYNYGAYTNSQWYATEAKAREVAANASRNPHGDGNTAHVVVPLTDQAAQNARDTNSPFFL